MSNVNSSPLHESILLCTPPRIFTRTPEKSSVNVTMNSTTSCHNEQSARIKEWESPASDDMGYVDTYDHLLPEPQPQRTIYRDCIKNDFCRYLKTSAPKAQYLDDIKEGRITKKNVHAYESRSQAEKNSAFLWSTFLQKSELLPGLLAYGAEINCYTGPGVSALHLAAFNGDVRTCRFLISQGSNVNFMRSHTPLHCAAYGNSPDVVKLLLEYGCLVDVGNDATDDGTPLHSAIKVNATECLRILVEKCTDINSLEPAGYAPLHLAAELGHIEDLKLLLGCARVNLNAKTRIRQDTALHLSAQNGYGECVSLLLSKGANADEKNYRNQTALHLAARAQSVECVKTLLKLGSCDVNALDVDQRSPLHSALTTGNTAYEVVEVLVEYGSDVNARDKYGCTPLHIAAINDHSKCVHLLFEKGADVCAKTTFGTTALGIITRRLPMSLRMFEEKLDSAISFYDSEVLLKEVELTLDFRQLLHHNSQGEISYLKTFVDEGHTDVLQHPLCEAFLHLKWAKIRKFYLVRLLFCLLYILSLTVYVFSYAHISEREPGTTPSVAGIISEENGGNKVWNEFKIEPDVIDIEQKILLCFTVCELCRKICGILSYSTFRQYIEQAENITEWVVVVSVFVMSFSTDSSSWRKKSIGAFAVLFGWTNLMFKIGQFPLFGPYVAMFIRVQKTFVKLFLTYCCLLIGFTFSFCVVLPSSMEFAYPHVGFIEVLIMMIGQMNITKYLAKIGTDDGTFFIIFSLFLLFVSVVMMNLLVGIAVHDIQGLQETAQLSKLERQTRIISQIELALLTAKHLPQCFFRLLQKASLLSPNTNRLVLRVKPFNRYEKRLPKELLKAAYKLAAQKKWLKQRSTIKVSPPHAIGSIREATKCREGSCLRTSLYDLISSMETMYNKVEESIRSNKKLAEEIRELKSRKCSCTSS